MNESHIAIRFRSNDGLHQQGDIQHFATHAIYVGQTQACQLRLPAHPDYADTCYAVIVPEKDGRHWTIIRQEVEADIRVNGLPLSLVQPLDNGDRLAFDQTEMEFSVEQGATPNVLYVKRQRTLSLWVANCVLALVLAAVIGYLTLQKKSVFDLYKPELESIYKIEADTLLVIGIHGDTLDMVSLPSTDIGTGFVTDDGYFVTARHCVEFWMTHEQELRPSLFDIASPVVRKAIEAELDTTIRLVAKLRLSSPKGMTYLHTSDDFLMDKSRDHLYEYGNFETSFLWRSVVSHYENRDAELGDVAIMKWNHGKGTIHLASPSEIMDIKKDNDLQGFGYPQNTNEQRAVLTPQEGRIFHFPENEERCFTCDKSFDHGFSGCPIFISTKANTHKAVIGIVSRSDGTHTLIVPVSQIHHLIEKHRCHE